MSGGLLFLADEQARLGQVVMDRNFQIGRRRLVFEYAPGKVEGRTMTGAEKSARPVGVHAVIGTAGKARTWRTTQVRTNADSDEYFGFDRSMFRSALFGLLILLRDWIADALSDFG
jgi:hypothetical protein